jgi:beta-mannanase
METNAGKTKKKFKILFKIALILFVIFFVAFMYCVCKYGFNRTVNKIKRITISAYDSIKHTATYAVREIKGQNNIYKNIDKESAITEYYINNVLQNNADLRKISNDNDVKLIIKTDTTDRFVNYPEGYYINLPANLKYDFTLSNLYIKAKSNDMQITLSKEWSPYEDVWKYIDYYQNRFILSEEYQKANNITLHENVKTDVNGYETQIISLSRNTDSELMPLKTYTYVYIRLYGQTYMRIIFKTTNYNEDYKKMYMDVIESFSEISGKYTSKNYVEYYPIKNDNWNAQTEALYDKYNSSNDISWGIFTKDVYTTGINETIPQLEKELDYDFDVVLVYHHLGNELPLQEMKKISDSGKVIEFTLQTCVNNNEKLYGYTPMLDIVEGKLDDQIVELAKNIKSLNTPILFRLNNEMNSDWTSYCGMVSLEDPDVYIGVWKRIYNIFKAQGVENCIWIYNPNDKNYPPSNWNDFLTYYPGNEYVQLIGITGYNTGTYYNKETGEAWREFTEIYDDIYKKYNPMFSKFNWIITEFSSSSIGGDKTKWINDMFKNIHKYKNIKIAVWFSYADYDLNGNVARPYWLDETKETLEAFKKGFNGK